MDQDDTEKLQVVSPPQLDLRPCLLMLTGVSAGRLIRLKQGESVVGRGEEVDISLRDRGISRRHAAFKVDEKSVTLEDLGSTNGTFLGAERVSSVALTGGERIQFGGSVKAKFDFRGVGEEQLLEGVTRDYLTGALNRAYFDQRLSEACAACRRRGTYLACAYIDIDHFKQLNDAYGHAAGDQVLQELVKRVEEMKRQNDTFARYGGEEFVLLLPETARDGAETIAERLRLRIASEPFEISTSEGRESLEVTVSVGVSLGSGEIQPQDLLEAADSALYQAKDQGRNRVRLSLAVPEDTGPLGAE